MFKGQLKGLFYWFGAGLVLSGFVIVNIRRDEGQSLIVEQRTSEED
jgi:hypothetical protein